MISVITPVYNAEAFLSRSIQSVLIQKEVTELILIDDGSTDNSWNIIQSFKNKDSRIIALRHYDKKNHGRSKTRNLGIKKATNNLIAFLDADDFYLENRFQKDLNILSKDKTIDGVYNALGIYFYDSYKGSKNISHVLTTMNKEIKPEDLFEKMSPIGKEGWFSGDAFIVKRDALIEVGLFNENLYVAEDTELWIKLALKYNLIYGDIKEPVAKRGVHGDNVFYDRQKYRLPRLLMYESLIVWAINNEISINRINILIDKYLETLKDFCGNNFLIYFQKWTYLLFATPKLVFKVNYWKALYKYLCHIYKKQIKRFL